MQTLQNFQTFLMRIVVIVLGSSRADTVIQIMMDLLLWEDITTRMDSKEQYRHLESLLK